MVSGLPIVLRNTDPMPELIEDTELRVKKNASLS